MAGAVSGQETDYAALHEQIEQLTKKVEALENRETLPVWQQVQPVAPCYDDSAPAAKKPSCPNAKLTGFFQADVGWFDQDALNRVTPVDGVPIGVLQDGADFRRARLAAVGDLLSNDLAVLSAGLNWYLNKNLKWQALYSYSTLDSIPVGESNVAIYAMRIQMDF